MILDGLDEYETATQTEVFRILIEGAPFADIILLSRSSADIEKGVTKIGQKTNLSRVKIRPDMTKADINQYIGVTVDELDLSDSDLAIAIGEKLRDKSQGMFLFVHLMIEQLEAQDTVNERRLALDVLPKELDDVYGRALKTVLKLTPKRQKESSGFCSPSSSLHSRFPSGKLRSCCPYNLAANSWIAAIYPMSLH